MLTSYLSKPNVMDLGMPGDRGCGGIVCDMGFTENRTLTLLLGQNNKIVSYIGYYSSPLESPKKLNFEKYSIRKELLLKKQQIVQEAGNIKTGLIVIIKPSKYSNYGNLVSILDEMTISKISTYEVVDITVEEENLLATK